MVGEWHLQRQNRKIDPNKTKDACPEAVGDTVEQKAWDQIGYGHNTRGRGNSEPSQKYLNFQILNLNKYLHVNLNIKKSNLEIVIGHQQTCHRYIFSQPS